jgi:DNA-binding NarL/FixJ family response regulator
VSSATRLLLVDEHSAFREELIRSVDSTEFVVCGEAADYDSAIAAADLHHPDIVITDLLLPGGDGLGLTRVLRGKYAGLRVIIRSAQEETAYAQRALQAGACGYVMKGVPADVVLTALRAVRDVGAYLSYAAFAQVARNASRRKAGAVAQVDALSAREREVVDHLAAGLTTAEIADRLGISAKTVYVHLDNVRDKLGIDSTAEVSRYALLLKSRSV